MKGKYKKRAERQRSMQEAEKAQADQQVQEERAARIAEADARHDRAVAWLAENASTLPRLRDLQAPLAEARSELRSEQQREADLRAAIVAVIKVFSEEWPKAIVGVKNDVEFFNPDFIEAVHDASQAVGYKIMAQEPPDSPGSVLRRRKAQAAERE